MIMRYIRLVPILQVLVVLSLCTAAAAQGYRGRSRPQPLTQVEKDEAVEALNALLAQVKEDGVIAQDQLEESVAILEKVGRALPGVELVAKLAELREYRKENVYPSPEAALGADHTLDRTLLSLHLRGMGDLAAGDVRAHPCSAGFPGPVSDDAERISRDVCVRTDADGWHNHGIYGNPRSPYWHSTGLYAAPGEVITVVVPESVVENGLSIRIGSHSDQLWRLSSWRRAPNVCVRVPIATTQTNVASEFGGLVYIESPFELESPAFTATISGAVASPYFVLGETDPTQWCETIRNLPAPWGELQTDKVVLTLPAADLRKLDDPVELMEFWDSIMDCYADLLGRSPQRRRAERFVPDIQISAGYMHSGYPLMTMLDITSTMVDKDRIVTNGHHGVWGLFHEIGHNHQNRDWTFRGTTEVTVNLFSLYVMEHVCELPLGGHPAVTEKSRKAAMAKHFAAGCDFEKWQSDPFLALAMYVQMQQEFGWEPFTEVFAEYRELAGDQRPGSEERKRDQWMARYSRNVGRDLGPFFEAWGVPTSDEARASIADLPKWMPEDLPGE